MRFLWFPRLNLWKRFYSADVELLWITTCDTVDSLAVNKYFSFIHSVSFLSCSGNSISINRKCVAFERHDLATTNQTIQMWTHSAVALDWILLQYWLIVVIHLCMTKLCTEKTREPHMSSYAMNWKIILNLIDEAPVYFKCLSPHDYRPCHSERTQFEFVRVLPSQPHSSLRTYCSCQPYTNAQTHEECAHIQGRLYVCVLCGIGKCYTWMYLTQKGFLWVTHTVCTDFCYFLYCFWRENFEEIFATEFHLIFCVLICDIPQNTETSFVKVVNNKKTILVSIRTTGRNRIKNRLENIRITSLSGCVTIFSINVVQNSFGTTWVWCSYLWPFSSSA